MFLENEILYGESFPVDDKILDKDFVVPIGKAKVLMSAEYYAGCLDRAQRDEPK